jgi:hypothetical protein
MKNQSIMVLATLNFSGKIPYFNILSFFLSIFKFVLIIDLCVFSVPNYNKMKTGLLKYCFAICLTCLVCSVKAQTSTSVNLNCVLNQVGSIVITPASQNNQQNSFVSYNENASTISINVFSSQPYSINVSAIDNTSGSSEIMSIANHTNINAGTIATKSTIAFSSAFFTKWQSENVTKNLFHYAVAKDRDNEVVDSEKTILYTVCNP